MAPSFANHRNQLLVGEHVTTQSQTYPRVGALLCQERWWLLGITLATLVVICGVFLLALSGGVGVRNGTLATLLATTVWTALAAPVLAASSRDWIRQFIRAGTVADAALVGLLIVWLLSKGRQDTGGVLTVTAAMEVYATLAGLAVFAAAVVGLARSFAWRHIAAAITAVVLLAMLATPFWTGGLIAATQGQWRDRVVTAAVWGNPVYSIASATAEELQYAPHQAQYMYDAQLTLIGDYAAAPPTPWYTATAILLIASAAAIVIRAIRKPSTRQ